MKQNTDRRKNPFIIWMLLAIPVVFIVSGPLHFLYDWTGQSVIVGLFTPVNESIWEHLKLAFWPILIWWVIGYLLYGRGKGKSPYIFPVTCAVAEIVCLLFILTFYYTYTGAFGIESLALDILSLFLGLVFAVLMARHVYIHTKLGGFEAFVAYIILAVLVAAFFCFTFSPPHLPLFQDPSTGTYGIPR